MSLVALLPLLCVLLFQTQSSEPAGHGFYMHLTHTHRLPWVLLADLRRVLHADEGQPVRSQQLWARLTR